MAYVKSIELFLVNGTADSLITAELSNWNGKAIKIPRIEIGNCDRDDIKSPGVYFLFGKEDDENESGDFVYIGESENIKDRLVQHIRDYPDKENFYWTTAVIFIGRDLNKALIRYLEDQLVQIARDSKRYKVRTKNTYSNTVIKESQKAAMLEFIDIVKVLVNTLGYKVLEPIVQNLSETSNREDKLFLKTRKGVATGLVTNEGFVLLKGSTIAETISNSVSKSVENLRNKFMLDQKIVDFKTTEDIIFQSSSAAAVFVTGNSMSGPISWKNQEGKTLKEIESKKANK